MRKEERKETLMSVPQMAKEHDLNGQGGAQGSKITLPGQYPSARIGQYRILCSPRAGVIGSKEFQKGAGARRKQADAGGWDQYTGT